MYNQQGMMTQNPYGQPANWGPMRSPQSMYGGMNSSNTGMMPQRPPYHLEPMNPQQQQEWANVNFTAIFNQAANQVMQNGPGMGMNGMPEEDHSPLPFPPNEVLAQFPVDYQQQLIMYYRQLRQQYPDLYQQYVEYYETYYAPLYHPEQYQQVDNDAMQCAQPQQVSREKKKRPAESSGERGSSPAGGPQAGSSPQPSSAQLTTPPGAASSIVQPPAASAMSHAQPAASAMSPQRQQQQPQHAAMASAMMNGGHGGPMYPGGGMYTPQPPPSQAQYQLAQQQQQQQQQQMMMMRQQQQQQQQQQGGLQRKASAMNGGGDALNRQSSIRRQNSVRRNEVNQMKNEGGLKRLPSMKK